MKKEEIEAMLALLIKEYGGAVSIDKEELAEELKNKNRIAKFDYGKYVDIYIDCEVNHEQGT